MASIETKNSTTYRIPEIGKVKPNVTIGGSDLGKFIPNINMSYEFESTSERYWWNLNAKGVVVASENQTFDDKTKEVALKVGDVEEKYFLDTDARGELLKWKRKWDKHPGVTSWDHEIQVAPGVAFYRQDALSQAKIDNGHHRPDEVIGSYAVYCTARGHAQNTKGGTIVNFKAGKMGDIFPPIFTDANSKTKKGEIFIDAKTGLYRVSIDKAWFDAAAFPVTANDTFGYTSDAATAIDIADQAGGGFYQASASGTVTSISFLLNDGADDINFGYYLGTASAVGNHVAHGTYKRGGPYTKNWDTINVSGSITASTDYWLIVQEAYVLATIAMYYDDGSNSFCHKGNTGFDTWNNSPTGFDYYSNQELSVYATYTAAGGGTTIVPAVMMYNRRSRK